MTSLATVAQRHLGEPGATDTCLVAINRWVDEAGGSPLPTGSVSAAVKLAQQGRNGWTYHPGLDGLRVGDVLRWSPDALGRTREDPNPEHVSVYVKHDGHGNLQSVGSGGPTGKVALQPQGGGFNPPRTFVGYFRVDVAPEAPAPAPKPATAAKPKPAAAPKGTYRVVSGDTLWDIAEAHHTSVPALLRANPPAADGRSHDYHVLRANLIIPGQRLHLP